MQAADISSNRTISATASESTQKGNSQQKERFFWKQRVAIAKESRKIERAKNTRRLIWNALKGGKTRVEIFSGNQ